MSSIGDVFLRVLADMKGFDAQIVKGSEQAGDKAAKGLTSRFRKGTRSGDLGKAFVEGLGIGGALGAVNAVTMATGKMVDVVFDSIDAASDQREAMSLTNQVFEEGTDEMATWAEGAEQAFGQSKTEALNFAATFGGVFKGVGEDMDSVGEKSQTLTRLAADLGSAFNTTGEEAATAIRSGLIGESEPLRRYNVLLSEAATKNEAIAIGIAKTGDELTDQQKVLARYSLIMKGTADSQGMFGRDTGSLADAQKRLQAQFENVQAEIGERLLPVMVDLAEFASDDLIPALEEAGGVIGELVGFVMDLEQALNDIAGPTEQAAKDADWLGSRTTLLGQAIHGLADLIDDSFDVLTFWDGWTLKAHEASDATAVATSVTKNMADATKDDLLPAMEKVQPPLQKVADLSDLIKDRQYDAAEAARALKDAMLDQANALIDEYYEPIELRDQIKDNNQKIRTAQQVLRSKKANAEQREDARDTVRELTKENEKASLALIATGDLTDKEFKGFINGLDTQIKNATGDAKRHLQSVRREALRLNGLTVRIRILQQVTTAGIIFTGVPTPGRQHGGPVEPGVAYWVGEAGREIFVPDEAGQIVSNDDSERLAGGGGGDTINIDLDVHGLPIRVETPTEIAAAMRRVASVGVLRTRRRRDAA